VNYNATGRGFEFVGIARREGVEEVVPAADFMRLCGSIRILAECVILREFPAAVQIIA